MIVLPSAVALALRRAAEAAYPEECCGLLLGRRFASGTVAIDRAVAAANVATGDRRRCFEIDPACRFRVLRQLRGGGGDTMMVGHYHSHPDCAAAPSAEDLAMAFETDLIWLIIAVNDGRAANVAAFQPVADGSSFMVLKLALGEANQRPNEYAQSD